MSDAHGSASVSDVGGDASAKGHGEDHELRILEAAFDDSSSDTALAKQVASCDDCLSYTFRIIDDVMALRARGKRPLSARSVTRLDAILSDAMLLLADAASPTGDETEKTGRNHKVPAGGA